MIQESAKHITFIVYNSPRPPRYLRINKKLLKTLTVSLPFLISFSILFSLATSAYMRNKLENLKSKEPELIAKLEAEKASLALSLKSMEKTNQDLINKISQGSTETAGAKFQLIGLPLGHADLTEKKMARLDNFKVNIKDNKSVLSFDLYNNLTSKQRLSGYITIIRYQGNSIEVYPQMAFSKDTDLVSFSSGESFSVSQFRPVFAEFNSSTSIGSWYKVFIFSRTGDLLAYNTFQEGETQ